MPNPYSLFALGATLAVSFLIFVLGGWWVDGQLHSGLIWTTTGACLSFIFIFYIIWKTINANN